jgi:hypothetical protein
MAITDLIGQLVRSLSQDGLTFEDVSAFVGPVVHDTGVPASATLRPVLPGVRAARLSRYPDSGLPYILTLEPDVASPTTPEALRPMLGDFRRARTDRGMPPEVVFAPASSAPRWKVVVIAQLEATGAELGQAPIISIALRRDPVRP